MYIYLTYTTSVPFGNLKLDARFRFRSRFYPFSVRCCSRFDDSAARYLLVVAAFDVVDGRGDKGWGSAEWRDGVAGWPDQEISPRPHRRPLSVSGDRLLAGDNDL